jgi:glucokinase
VEQPAAIGVGTAGVVTADGGRIAYAPNLPLDGFALADHLRATHGLPAVLINDGRASVLGEYRHGYAKGRDPLLALFFGTGIGIGLIVGGTPYGGATNAAGEIGHTVHVPRGRACSCGRLGCYEAYCGGGPMCRRAAGELGAAPNGGPTWTVGDIVAAAERSAAARQILDDAAQAAEALVASACTLLNPAAVVLGGGMLKGWPALRARIERATFEWCSDIVKQDLVFVPSRGESDAILWGAAVATGRLW